ncbi:MAG: RNA-binding domain-containing protein [Syntrophales bacterium]
MTLDDLTKIIAEVQKLQSELDDLEVKAAQKGTPQRLFEALSAFSNRPGGGVLLLGLDESKRFENVGVGNAHRLQEEISHLAAAEMEPPLRPEFTVKDFVEKILAYVRKHGSIKRAECQALLGVTELRVRYILQRMRNNDLLKLKGTRKGSVYHLF